MNDGRYAAYVLLHELELLGSFVMVLAWLRDDGVKGSPLDWGLGRRPSRRGWHSARPNRSRELWLLIRRLPCFWLM